MSYDETFDPYKGLAIRKQMELPTKPPPPPNRWRTEYKRAVNEWFVYDAGGYLDCTLKSQKAANRIVQMGNRIEEQREGQVRLEQQATQIAAMADKMLLVLREAVEEMKQRGRYKHPKLAPDWADSALEIVNQFETVEI